jgi:hypothetical protein
MPQAQAGPQGGASPPRLVWRWWPTSCPRATPSERACGEGHEKGTRNHRRTRLRDLVQAVERPVQENGPGPYQLSQLSYAPEVTAVVERRAAEQHLTTAA